MMQKILIVLSILTQFALADTPPPNTVKAKVYSGDGLTGVTTTGTALNVNVTNPGGGSSTVNQGTGGLSPWLVHADNTAFGRTWTLLNSTDSVNAVQSGTWSTGRTWSLSSGSDSVAASVSNFPAVQPVSQSGTWTIGQGTPPWEMNLTQLAGASFSATNYLPSRLTNGTSYVDPTQIRALSSGTDSVAVSGTVTANAGTGTFQTNVTNASLAVTQSGSWTTGRTWSLSSGTDSVSVTGSVTTGGLTDTQLRASAVPISAAALPLPSGAATAANQATANSSLSSIDGKTPALGQALAAASTPVVLTAAQLSTLTPLSTVAVTQSTSPWVVSGTVTANQGGTWNINNISGTISLPTGAATDNSISVVNANMTNGNLRGSVTANAGTNLNTSALALDATLAKLTIAQGASLGSNTLALIGGSVTTSVPTYTTGQISPLSLTVRGALRSKVVGLDTVTLIRNVYSTTNVTTAAYVQLVASTSSDINRLMIFDSSGQDLVLAVGGAGSEVNQIQIPPGGWDAPVELFIPSGSRISIKATSATASSGTLLITGLK